MKPRDHNEIKPLICKQDSRQLWQDILNSKEWKNAITWKQHLKESQIFSVS